MAFLQARDVGLIDKLKKPVGDINKRGQSRLSDALGGISSQATASMRGRGVSESDYIPAEIARSGATASRGIEDSLLNALGGASLDETTKQKEHLSNMALAREIGALTKPSVLEQVIGGLGGGARAGGQFYSLYDQLKTPKPRTRVPSTSLLDYGYDSEEMYG